MSDGVVTVIGVGDGISVVVGAVVGGSVATMTVGACVRMTTGASVATCVMSGAGAVHADNSSAMMIGIRVRWWRIRATQGIGLMGHRQDRLIRLRYARRRWAR